MTKQEEIEQEREQYTQNFSEIENDLQQVARESDLNKVLGHLFKDGNILELTELSKPELGKISTLYTYAKKYGFKELENLILNNLMLRVSLKRKGRNESVQIANAQLNQEVELLKAQAGLQDKRAKRG